MLMKHLLTGVAVCAVSTAAMAADLPSKSMPQLMQPLPAFTWTGFYGGVFLGGAYQVSNSTPTYQSQAGNGVGFGTPAANGTAVRSSWYNDYATGGPATTSPYVNATAFSSNVFPNSGSTSTTINLPTITSTRTDSLAPNDLSHRGLVGALGLQAGANYQKGRLVVGVAGDLSWFSRPSTPSYSSTGAFDWTDTRTASASSVNINGVDSTTSSSVTQTNSGESAYSGSAKVAPQWLSTLRLTAGIANERLLTFASAGLAFGSVQTRLSSSYSDSVSSSCSGAGNSFANGVQSNAAYVDCGGTVDRLTANSEDSQSTSASWRYSSNKLRTGYVVGGGFAYALTDNTILKLESYYYDLGKQTVNVTGTATTTNNAGNTSSTNVASYKVQTSMTGVLGRVGVDFKY